MAIGFRSLIRNFTLREERTWLKVFARDSWAGKPVTADTAMQLAAFWACVRLISQTIATLPLGLYQRRADGGRDVASSHPLYVRLHDQPNGDHTSVEFWEGVVACLCVWGNSFVEKSTANGRLLALTLLRPDLISVHRDRHGALFYRYSAADGLREYAEDDIMHIRGFGFGGDLGLSPVSYARNSLGAVMATDEAAARTFANGLRPGGVLTYEGPQLLTTEQREQARKALIEPFSGSENAGKTLLLEGAAGFKWQDVHMPPRDAEMLASRAFHVEEIARWFGVPPVLIGHSPQGQTMWGSGVEQIMLGWLTLGLRPYLTRIEQAIKRSLIAAGERSSLYAEFTIEGLLRADSVGRAEMYSKLLQTGSITPNEIRDKENLPRFAGGDVHLVNSTLVPLAGIGAAPGSVQKTRVTKHDENGRILEFEREVVPAGTM